MEPTLPSRQFKTLVKVQRDNGACLIDGKSINYFFNSMAESAKVKTSRADVVFVT